MTLYFLVISCSTDIVIKSTNIISNLNSMAFPNPKSVDVLNSVVVLNLVDVLI